MPGSPSILIAGPVNVRASLERALGEHEVRVHGCSFSDLIATCAGTSPALVVLAGSMKGAELNVGATALADHAATRNTPVAILTSEPGAPPTRRADAAPMTLVLSHQGIAHVAARLAELAQRSPAPRPPAPIAEESVSSIRGGKPLSGGRLDPFLDGDPTEDTGSGPIRALHLRASIASDASPVEASARDWTWEDSPQGTPVTDDNELKDSAKRRRLARTMMGVAPAKPSGATGGGPVQGSGVGADDELPAPRASRAGVWGSTSESSAPTGFPAAKPLARAVLRKAEPSHVGPLPDEGQAPVISPIVAPLRPAAKKSRPKTMLGVGLPSKGAGASKGAKMKPRTMLGLGLPAAGSSASPPSKPASPLASRPAASAPTPPARKPSAPAIPAVPAPAPRKPSAPSMPAVSAPAPRKPSAPSMPAVSAPAPRKPSAPSMPAVAASPASPASSAKSASGTLSGAPSPLKAPSRRPASRTMIGGMTSPLGASSAPARGEPTAAYPTGRSPAPLSKPETAASTPSTSTPAASRFGGAASMDFADEPTVVGDSVREAVAKGLNPGGFEDAAQAPVPVVSSAALSAPTREVDLDAPEPSSVPDAGQEVGQDLDLDDDMDDATQVLDQSSIAMAKLEALRAKSAKPDAADVDTLRPPPTPLPGPVPTAPSPLPPADLGERLANKAPNEEDLDDLETAETEPPPAGVGLRGVSDDGPPPPGFIPEATMSLTDALELDSSEFLAEDPLGRTMGEESLESSDSGAVIDDAIVGGAANPDAPIPVRPPGYQQSHSGTEEDTEIVAGLTKQLEAEQRAKSSKKWVWATLGLCAIGAVAAGAVFAPKFLGETAHSGSTTEEVPVPSGPLGTTGAEGQPEVPPAPVGDGDPATAEGNPEATAEGNPEAADPAVDPATDPATDPTVDPAANPTAEATPEPEPPVEPPVEPPAPEPPPEVAAVEPTPPPVAPTPAVDGSGLPSDPTAASEALVARAETQASGGDAAGAQASLRRAIELDDENYEAMASLAALLIAGDSPSPAAAEEAVNLANRAVRRRARVGRYHLIYGDARAAAGDRRGASRSWSRAEEVDPSLAAEVRRR